MKRIQVGVVRWHSVATAIAHALGVHPAPDCRIGHGRITLTFRRLGASQWSQEQQMEFALKVATIARNVIGDDPRRAVRRRATRAIVVVYEDTRLIGGCEVIGKWECVIPSGVQ